MNQKFTLTLTCAVALAIGFALGRTGSQHQSVGLKEGDVEHHLDLIASNHAMFNVHALGLIRSGQLNDATQFLEERLDSEIVTFLGFEKIPNSQRSEACKLALKHARDYRKKYPWRNPIAEVDNAVQRLLAAHQ